MPPFKSVPGSDAAPAYELGVKAFGRDGTPSPSGMKLLLRTAQEELNLPNEISAAAVTDFGPLMEVKKEMGIP